MTLPGKRVLYICEYAALNGGERSLLSWLPVVLSRGIEAHAISPGSGALAASFAEVGVAVLPWGEDVEQSKDKLAARRKQIGEVIDRLEPHLVHANSLSMSRAAGPVAASRAVPSVAHIRDIVGISAQAMRDVSANPRILAVSQATAEFHIAAGLCRQRTHVVYNGVDRKVFAPRAATRYLHRELNLPNDANLLGAVGQIGMRKGLDVLLQAMANVLAENFDVHLIVAGERSSQKEAAVEYERALHNCASRSPLAGRVHFVGRRDDLPALMNELTLLVHAARQEPLGRVLLEAACAGVAVVATDVGGTREIFPDGQAIIVPPDDAPALARAITLLLNGQEVIARLRGSALAEVAPRFDAGNSAGELLAHYETLLNLHS